jgi:SAM-dependent methyltransferase
VLDVGAGARPAFGPESRPAGVHYVGIDVSAAELGRAELTAYDETRVSDVLEFIGEWESRFDLIVSWQTLEHVKPLAVAVENLRRYLRPGGLLVAHLSGSRAAYAVASRLLPHTAAQWVSARLLGRDPDTMFPTHYDRCHYQALLELLSPWREVEVVPRYAGADYFSFSRRLRSLYLLYENWAFRHDRRSLATHYLISARR